MSILCTMPGRHGDILWALPTVRAISERAGEPVGLLISAKYGSLCDLIRQQPYIKWVNADPFWEVQETAPMSPRIPQRPVIDEGMQPFDQIFHLGYEGWPADPLPYDIARRAGVEIDLSRPWITAKPMDDAVGDPYPVVCGWSDEYFELKFGITLLAALQVPPPFVMVCAPQGRWATEFPVGLGCLPYQTDWLAAASFVASAKVFFGCCSALHVLAVALGVPAVIMEPAPARHHPIFWPLGTTGPAVTLVRGGDGQPTMDSRHCAETLQAVLARTDIPAIRP